MELLTKFRLSSTPNGLVYDVALSTDGILMSSTTTERRNATKKCFVPYADIVGASIERDSRSSTCAISVYAYPKTKSILKKEDRRFREVKLYAKEEEGRGDHVTRAEAWKGQLMERVYGKSGVPPRKFLVFVNPASGRGKAERIYRAFVAPMFAQAEIETEVIITEYEGHARNSVETREDIFDFDAIIIVSGDGLHHEIINGFMARPDWSKAMKIPLGAIPGGSGNSLVCSLLHLANEPFTPTCAGFACARGRPAPLDILSVDTPTETRYSFLSVTWGMVANIDIKSEQFRWMGEARFTAGFFSELRSLPKYRGKFYYLPVSQSEALSRENSIETTNSKPVSDLLPSFDEEPSEEKGWKVIDGEFVTLAASLLTHIGSDLFIAPPAHLAGGILYVFLIPATCSRLAVLKSFVKMEEGHHLHVPGTELIGVRAMRLQPEVGGARRVPEIMSIDGERIAYGPMQVQVHRAVGRVLILKSEKLLTESDIGTPV